MIAGKGAFLISDACRVSTAGQSPPGNDAVFNARERNLHASFDDERHPRAVRGGPHYAPDRYAEAVCDVGGG